MGVPSTNCTNNTQITGETDEPLWSQERIRRHFLTQLHRTSEAIKGSLQEILPRSLEATVGLENISEHQVSEINETYHCKLCGFTSNPYSMYKHIVEAKHRNKYLNEKEMLVPRQRTMSLHQRMSLSQRAKISAEEYEINYGRHIEQIQVYKTSAQQVFSEQSTAQQDTEKPEKFQKHDGTGSSTKPENHHCEQPSDNCDCVPKDIHQTKHTQLNSIHSQFKKSNEGKEEIKSKWSPGTIYDYLNKVWAHGSLQKVLSESSDPIIGLEYISEHIVKYVGRIYYCYLCNLTTSPYLMYQHIIRMNHRLEYLQHKDVILPKKGFKHSQKDYAAEYESQHPRQVDKIMVYSVQVSEAFPEKSECPKSTEFQYSETYKRIYAMRRTQITDSCLTQSSINTDSIPMFPEEDIHHTWLAEANCPNLYGESNQGADEVNKHQIQWSTDKICEYLSQCYISAVNGSLQEVIPLCCEPTIGLEYISEHRVKDILPTYHCVLCNKTNTPSDMYQHITGKSHRKEFLYEKGITTLPKKGFNYLPKEYAEKYESTHGKLVDQIKIYEISASEAFPEENRRKVKFRHQQNYNSIKAVRNNHFPEKSSFNNCSIPKLSEVDRHSSWLEEANCPNLYGESNQGTDEVNKKQSLWSRDKICDYLILCARYITDGSLQEVIPLSFEPIVGLEYISEHRVKDIHRTYHCMLCNKIKSPSDMYLHIIRKYHRKEFLSQKGIILPQSGFDHLPKEYAEQYDTKHGRLVEQIKIFETSAKETFPKIIQDPQNSEFQKQQKLNGIEYVTNDPVKLGGSIPLLRDCSWLAEANCPNLCRESNKVSDEGNKNHLQWSTDKICDYLMRCHKNDINGSLQDVIPRSCEPTIGLEHISEHRVQNIRPIYHCNLCNVSCDPSIMYKHIIGTKHRRKVLYQNVLIHPQRGFKHLQAPKEYAEQYESTYGRLVEQIKIYEISVSEAFPVKSKYPRNVEFQNPQNFNGIEYLRNDPEKPYFNGGSIPKLSEEDSQIVRNLYGESNQGTADGQNKETESQWSTARIHDYFSQCHKNAINGSLQEVLPLSAEPTIGLEYISEHRLNNFGSKYHCNLCSIILTQPWTAYEHVIDANHRNEYLLREGIITIAEKRLKHLHKEYAEKYEKTHGRHVDQIKVFEEISINEVSSEKSTFPQLITATEDMSSSESNDSSLTQTYSSSTSIPQRSCNGRKVFTDAINSNDVSKQDKNYYRQERKEFGHEKTGTHSVVKPAHDEINKDSRTTKGSDNSKNDDAESDTIALNSEKVKLLQEFLEPPEPLVVDEAESTRLFLKSLIRPMSETVKKSGYFF